MMSFPYTPNHDVVNAMEVGAHHVGSGALVGPDLDCLDSKSETQRKRRRKTMKRDQHCFSATAASKSFISSAVFNLDDALNSTKQGSSSLGSMDHGDGEHSSDNFERRLKKQRINNPVACSSTCTNRRHEVEHVNKSDGNTNTNTNGKPISNLNSNGNSNSNFISPPQTPDRFKAQINQSTAAAITTTATGHQNFELGFYNDSERMQQEQQQLQLQHSSTSSNFKPSFSTSSFPDTATTPTRAIISQESDCELDHNGDDDSNIIFCSHHASHQNSHRHEKQQSKLPWAFTKQQIKDRNCDVDGERKTNTKKNKITSTGMIVQEKNSTNNEQEVSYSFLDKVLAISNMPTSCASSYLATNDSICNNLTANTATYTNTTSYSFPKYDSSLSSQHYHHQQGHLQQVIKSSNISKCHICNTPETKYVSYPTTSTRTVTILAPSSSTSATNTSNHINNILDDDENNSQTTSLKSSSNAKKTSNSLFNYFQSKPINASTSNPSNINNKYPNKCHNSKNNNGHNSKKKSITVKEAGTSSSLKTSSFIKCDYCDRLACTHVHSTTHTRSRNDTSCTAQCEKCHGTFCKFCYTTNYDCNTDRYFCLECNQNNGGSSNDGCCDLLMKMDIS